MSSQGSSTVPYIGARISLISNTNSRYEGILYTIDPKEATVALQNVRCFGTEGREARPEEAVEASPDIYEYIIFRGRDIKDLHVSERPTAPPKPKPLQDPAILSANLRPPAPIQPPRTQGGQFGSQSEFHPMAPGGIGDLRSSQGGQSGDENKQAQQGQSQGGQGQASAAPADGGKGGDGYSGPGTGEFLKRPARHQHQLKPQGGVVPSGEFDFEEANKRFNKDSMVATLAAAGKKKDESDTKQDSKADEETIAKLKALNIDPSQAPAVGPKYDKKRSFFDEISTDRDARERPESDQLSRVNEETFGDGAANYRSRNFRQFRPRGGAGHRGRGGGGRGRGGRGGGNNHNHGGGEGGSQNREWRNSNRNPDNYGRGRGGRRRDDHGNDRRDDRDNREKRNAPSSYAAAVSASS